MRKINKIMCCCGQGLGSSLIVHLNVEDVLKKNGIRGVEVCHASISEIDPRRADVFIVGLDIAKQLESYPRVIVVKELISFDEIEEKLLKAFNIEKDEFWIE